MHESIKTIIQAAGDMFEIIGVGCIVIGFVVATVMALRYLLNKKHDGYWLFKYYRQNLARAILIGLEFLVAGDIIRTVAGDLTLEGVVTLAGVVAIRIVLGITLEAETGGEHPSLFQTIFRRKQKRE